VQGVVTHTVAVGQFEGPLGLLLDLVESGQIEISTISIGDITSRYLAKIAQMEVETPEELADFVELGARLLYIKSLSLLPDQSDTEPKEEMARLNQELAVYRQMQTAAKLLSDRLASRSWSRTLTDRLDPSELPYPDLVTTQLSQAFAKVLSRQIPVAPVGVIRRHLSQKVVIEKQRGELANGGFSLQSLVSRCRDRLEIIVTFLALLELWREGVATVVQSGQFEDIRVEPTHA
jgi:segregation and condensation protein A